MGDEYKQIKIKLDELVRENEEKKRLYSLWKPWEVELLVEYWPKLTPAQRKKHLVEEAFGGRHSYEACLSKYRRSRREYNK